VILGLGLALGAGCRRSPAPPSSAGAMPPLLDPDRFSGQRALEEVIGLVRLGPRVSGTDGAEHAARYLAQRLREIGLMPTIDEFEDPTPEGPKIFRNVLAAVGAEPTPAAANGLIVLVSHYDTKAGLGPTFAGANDSGSSTGLLLELARLLAGAPPRDVSVLLAFVDGEECRRKYGVNDGLHGSRRLARRLKADGRAARVSAVLVVDMIGDRDLTVTIPANSSRALLASVFRAAHAEGVRQKFALSREMMIDDHVPFLRAGMPALDLIDFRYGAGPGRNDYWHTSEDTIDKLSPASLETVGRVVARVVNEVGR